MGTKGFFSEKGVGVIFDKICVLDGKRTPFGKYTGTLSSVSPTDLGISSSRSVIDSVGVDPKDIDQVIVSNIGQSSGDAFFLPRHVALYCGMRIETPASLVQRICGSGIEVIGSSCEQIALGKANLVLGCGTETMSRFPLASFGARQGFPLGRPEFIDLLWEALNDTAAVPMGVTADKVAEKYHIKKDEVDAFALSSGDRYFAAKARGFFQNEISPIGNIIFEREGLNKRKVKLSGVETLSEDEHPRKSSLDKIKNLPFVFTKSGPTTAATASGIVDGAASILVASESWATSKGYKPLGYIRAVSAVGVEPEIMGIGPVPAIKSVLSALNMKLNEIDLFEINEAFGAQCLGVAKCLELDLKKLNINGGAIAIGHPLGATGVRLVTTLLKSLHEQKKRWGVASACIGGGQGIAMVVEANI